MLELHKYDTYVLYVKEWKKNNIDKNFLKEGLEILMEIVGEDKGIAKMIKEPVELLVFVKRFVWKQILDRLEQIEETQVNKGLGSELKKLDEIFDRTKETQMISELKQRKKKLDQLVDKIQKKTCWTKISNFLNCDKNPMRIFKEENEIELLKSL